MLISEEGIISERMLEDYLVANPGYVEIKADSGYIYVDYWLKRQYPLPNGRLDLLGQLSDGNLAMVELKNVHADGDAVAQVSRYAYDIRLALQEWRNAIVGFDESKMRIPDVRAMVVAPSFSDAALYSAEALDVNLIKFTVVGSRLEITFPAFTEYGLKWRAQKRKQVAYDIFMARKKHHEDIIEGIRNSPIGWMVGF